MERSREHENCAIMVDTVVANTLEKRLSPGDKRKVVDTVTNSTITVNDLLQMRNLHERHEVFHEIELDHNLEEIFDLDI